MISDSKNQSIKLHLIPSHISFQGNPNVITDCLASAAIACDRHIEEECEYIGNVIQVSHPGSIVDSTYCEGYCENAIDPNFRECNYWYYMGPPSGNICTALESDDKICKAIGGPQKPSLEECLGTL